MNLSTSSTQKIAVCLWFESQAEEAVAFYVSIFPDSRITLVSLCTEAGFQYHGKPADSVMAIGFELRGQPFTALNGGSPYKLSEAMSLIVHCDTQEEIDYYWELLGKGGDPACQACGWLSVFQLYSSETAMKAFIGGDWYPGYLSEVAEVVASPPQLTHASLAWAKSI